jgi:hypothetical protein
MRNGGEIPPMPAQSQPFPPSSPSALAEVWLQA